MNPLFNITIALIIIGAYCVINWEGMLLYSFRLWWEKSQDNMTVRQADIYQYISKPLFTCPYCMSSVWTLAAYWATQKALTLMIFPNILCTMGIVVVLFSAIQYFRNEQ